MNLIKSEKELYGSFKVDIKSVMKMENISRTKLSKVTGIKYDIIMIDANKLIWEHLQKYVAF